MESTVFQQLLQAVLSYQTGTVNIRRILSPLFTEETADEENRQFYTEYDMSVRASIMVSRTPACTCLRAWSLRTNRNRIPMLRFTSLMTRRRPNRL
jgi:hypothetical protein